ncbi:MAG: M56 family metallopeptidase [Gammaproteobacteria bacterium]
MMDSFLDTFANAWYSHKAIQVVGEALLISLFVFAVFLLLDLALHKRLSAQSRHLLILGGFASTFTFLAISQFDLSSVSDSRAMPALVTLTVSPSAFASSGFDWGKLLLTLYLVPVLLLMSRLLLGLWQLRRLRGGSSSIEDVSILCEVTRLKEELRISGRVDVCTSAAIHSPLSFGGLNPLVLLPPEALQWPEQTLRHVLSHELSHVQRGDWVSKLLCYVMASALWLNPLSWRLLRRLDSCAESACDMQAAALENDSADYAVTLVSVARSCQKAVSLPPRFAQSMLERSTLETRIVYLLEGKKMKTKELKKERRNVLFTVALLSTLLIVTMANIKIVSAQPSVANVERRGEILPINFVEPVYPKAAADQGIEGWVQVKFTVDTDGLIAEDTVEVVDAEPLGVFDDSAIAAAKKFRFTLTSPNGSPVAVPNVQYVFRYKMNDEEV